jgi:aspartate aminotransferase
MTLRPAARVAGLERTLIRRMFEAAPADAINLGLGQPDLPTPPAIALAGVDAIVRGRTAYTATAGLPALRQALAERYAPFARGPECVVVTVGSQEAMFAALLCLTDPGDEVLIPDPGYPAYPVVTQLVGARPVTYALRPERGFRVDPSDIESALTPRTRVAILCSPSNPTGAVNADADVEAVVRRLEKRGVAWMSDEIYSGFTYEGAVSSPSHYSSQGVVISGLSKDLSMTGWRVGWLVGPASVAEKAIAAHQYLVTCGPSISQHAALAALGERGRAEARRHLEIFRRRRRTMRDALDRIDGISFESPAGAFYFFVNVSRFGSSLELARRVLDRRRVITVPGEAFGERGRGYLRLSFAAREAEIVRGVRALGEELATSG